MEFSEISPQPKSWEKKNDEKIIQLNGEKESKEKWFGEIYICASATFNLFSSYGFVIHEILSDE